MEKRRYTHRFLARIIIEAITPISVGSGEKGFMSDHLVARDVNGLPYIPGTAVAGIVRHAMSIEIAEKFFGCNITEAEKKKKEKGGKKGQKESSGEGSQIIFSSAHLVQNKAGDVADGLILNVFDDQYLTHFENLPVRQHVRINAKGTSEEKGKFDEEVVYKGTRFCFEIEMVSENATATVFDEVITHLASDTLCIGSGTRSGHGEFEIKECLYALLDLKNNKKQREAYIEKTSSLNDPFWKKSGIVTDKTKELQTKDMEWVTCQLELKPEDFFFFGSGFGDEKSDMTPVREAVIEWESNLAPQIVIDCVLIPGSSVKGALSHRVAFHYNRLNGIFVDEITKGLKKEEIPAKMLEHVGGNNKAVKVLFGYTSENEKDAARGNIMISDVIRKRESDPTKILNHVSIDRFTGGAIDGALFSEEVMYGKDDTYTLTFKVKGEALKDNTIKQAFKDSLFDIAKGMLPLGGGTNRGHGCFTGKIIENGYKK